MPVRSDTMEKKFSSQIMQLRFMQRAVEKSKEPSSDQRAQIQERWVVEGAKDRCIVLMEGDPAMSCDGRLSFSNVRNENDGDNDDARIEINNRARELVEHKEPELASGTENGAHDAQLELKSNSSIIGKRNSER
jgi:hypothetical protein